MVTHSTELSGHAPKLLFIQPFSLDEIGGGAKIFRGLFESAPVPCMSLNVSPARTVSNRFAEYAIPYRPKLGRIESTRLAGPCSSLATAVCKKYFTSKLIDFVRSHEATHAHVLAHDANFATYFAASQAAGLDTTLCIHDHFGYSIKNPTLLLRAMRLLGYAWDQAGRRIVISEAMGQEFCRQFSTQPYTVITDSLNTISRVKYNDLQPLVVYFMGLLHNSYLPNFQCMSQALAQVAQVRPVRWIVRGGTFVVPNDGLPPEFRPPVTGSGAELTLQQDLEEVNLLYLPLPLDSQHSDFTRFSLSTKLISYCGSGLPILYHGPEAAAARDLLVQNGACIDLHSLDCQTLVECLLSLTPQTASLLATNATQLAEQYFARARVAERFWDYYGGSGHLAPPVI